MTFDEITKKGVQKGMANPRAIDEDLFNAQQARRILDRLVAISSAPSCGGRYAGACRRAVSRAWRCG